jgi:prepilin signal peptidase PulO-like enzyme (type II secretory pathway)
MVLFYAVVAFIYGTLFSSFFTLVGYRVPLKISVVKPNSQCFSCGHRLHFMDLIPIVSYFLRKGKCHYCGVKYGSFHVIMEISVGLLFFIGTYLYIDDLFKLFSLMVLILCLVVVFVSLKEHNYVITEFVIVAIMMFEVFILSSLEWNYEPLMAILFIIFNHILIIDGKYINKKIKSSVLLIDLLLIKILLLSDIIVIVFG